MNFTKSQRVGLILGPVIALIFCFLSLPGLDDIATRVVGLTLWMVVWWVTTPVPLWVTALLPIAGSIVMNIAGDEALESGLNTYASYGAPVTVMVIGVFVLGAVIEKWNLHKRIALNILNLFKGKPVAVVFGFGIATGLISMFMSNTTAVAMLLPIAMALNTQLGFTAKDGFSKALVLTTAYAGSIGGMATVIGSGTNMASVGLIKDLVGIDMSFTDWLTIGLPFVILILPLSVLAICKMFHVKDYDLGDTQVIKNELEALGPMSKAEKIATVYLIITILVFVFNDQITSLVPWLQYITNEGWGIVVLVLAFMIPVDWKNGQFLMDGKYAVEKISWGTFVLLGGALTLGGMFNTSGVAGWIASGLGFLKSWPKLAILIFLCVIVSILTEAVSNFVVVAAFMPALVGLADTVNMSPMFIMMAVALSSSLAFMLPSGTPPNALVFGTNYLETKDMVKAGLVVKIIGIILFPIVMFLIAQPLSPLF
jgi:solute carrier family 13 (sodium-dependent dicarboxylate transporter), member 2/3/5